MGLRDLTADHAVVYGCKAGVVVGVFRLCPRQGKDRVFGHDQVLNVPEKWNGSSLWSRSNVERTRKVEYTEFSVTLECYASTGLVPRN